MARKSVAVKKKSRFSKQRVECLDLGSELDARIVAVEEDVWNRYVEQCGKKIVELAIGHIDTAIISFPNARVITVLRLLKRRAGESRSHHVAFEMFEKIHRRLDYEFSFEAGLRKRLKK